MAARRCSIDGISYPEDYKFHKCPVCGETTDWFSDVEPDEDWDWKATLLIEQHAGAEAEPPEIPTVSSDVPVHLRAGQLTIHSWDLYHARHRDKLAPGDLIQVGKQTFEVLEYVPIWREYLVRSFSLTLSDEDLSRLADGR